MERIIALIINNMKRIKNNKISLIITFLIIPISIGFACFTASKDLVSGKVAIIGSDKEYIDYLVSQKIDYDELNAPPSNSDIIEGKYIGTIYLPISEGKYVNYRGQDNEKILKKLVDKKSIVSYSNNDKLGLIYGYVVLFVIIQAVLNMKLYTQNRELGILKRICSTGTSFSNYIICEVIYNFLMVFIPTIFSIYIFKFIFNVKFNASYVEIILLTALITILAISIALFICTVIQDSDSAIMTGNIVALFTTILSGAFMPINCGGLIQMTSNIMPQKIFLDIVSCVEKNGNLLYYNLLIILLISMGLVIFSILYNVKIIREGRC
ncbi:ABC transporter permease [Clostridium sp. YIM B02569]|uniref:ABC transporter permease n=1 Tax=Clostridium sp. YIM B02569 TaxID=2911967 RepID=UPI001EEAE1AC|nr:ABC transporter permease [Clostridium sp. YIM B02569]